MKKLLLTTLLFAGLAPTASAINWDVVKNIVPIDAEVTASTNQKEAHQITNSNTGDRWQAVPRKDVQEVIQYEGDTPVLGVKGEVENDWVIINLGDSKTFTDIEIFWEGANANAYKVFVSQNPIPYIEKDAYRNEKEKLENYFVIDPDWLNKNEPICEVSLPVNESNHSDEISFSSVKGQYILIYCMEYNGLAKDWGSSIFTIKAGLIEGRDQLSSISIPSVKIVNGQSTELTVSLLNPANGVLNDYNGLEVELVSSDADAIDIEYFGEGRYKLVAQKRGNYTLNASVTDGEKSFTANAPLTITTNWDEVPNVAIGKAIMGRYKTPVDGASDDNEHGFEKATDGDVGTYYEYNGGYGGGDSWVIIDLQKEYAVGAVEVLFGNNGTFRVGLGEENQILPAEDQMDIVLTSWFDNNWTPSENLARTANSISPFFLTEPKTARYIVIYDIDNPDGKPKFMEIYVDGIAKDEQSKAVAIILESSENNISQGESITLTAKLYDQYGAPMDINEGFEYSSKDYELLENSNAPTLNISNFSGKIGSYNFNVKYENLEAECTIYVRGDSSNKLILTGDNKLPYELSIDGTTIKADLNANGDAVNADHGFGLNKTLRVDFLNNTLDVSLINIRWEAACPSDYTVNAIYGDNSTEEILKVEGRAYVDGYNPIDRIYKPSANDENNYRRVSVSNAVSNLNNIKALEIKPTATLGHNYSLRLFGVDLYGEARDISTGVETIENYEQLVDVYTLSGVRVADKVNFEEIRSTLAPGLYIVGNKKMIIR